MLAGYGIGYAWAGQQGAVIGAGVGLAVGVLLAIPILWTMRRPIPFVLRLSKPVLSLSKGDEPDKIILAMKPFWIYILRCADGSYYTGHTDDLETRIAQHQQGSIRGCYTLNRRPLELVFSQTFASREEALSAERQVKGWNRRKKEAMIRGDWAEVARLARSAE